MTFRHITILGLGLLGGSVGMAIRRYIDGCKTTGYDISAGRMHRAFELEAIDEGTAVLEEACAGADLIVVCVPVGAFDALIRTVAPLVAAGTIVTDVLSTKRSIVRTATELLPAGSHFVGSHPMAGGERSGVESARPDLFDGSLCLLTPIAETDFTAAERVESFWRKLGMQTRRLSPERHDYLVAEISHLPHVLASCLMLAVSGDGLNIAGPGFRDVTRVAAGEGTLWRDILLDNADELRRILRRFRGELDAFEKLLNHERSDQLLGWLETAAARRRGLGKTFPPAQ